MKKYEKQEHFIQTNILHHPFFKNRLIKKQKSNSTEHIYNMRCPICGDSKNNPNKKRGYLLWKRTTSFKGQFKYKCHNCGKSITFEWFLKYLEKFGLTFYSKWRKTIGFFLEKTKEIRIEKDYDRFFHFQSKIYDIVSNIEDNIKVRSYVEKRKIPKKFWNTKVFSYSGTISNLIKSDALNIFSNEVSTASSFFIPKDYVVLVQEAFVEDVPLIVGFSLRSIDDTQARYFKIPILNFHEPVFFSNVLDYSDIEDYPIFVVEGQIDSLMFDNPTFAVQNSNLMAINEIEQIKENEKIYIFDNDYVENKDIRNKMMNLPMSAKSVLWHLDKTNKHKDANKMVQKGLPYPLDKYIIPLIKSGLQRTLYLKKLGK
jgi:5S rRNA maturation endonuclease (ribonuclease M5)